MSIEARGGRDSPVPIVTEHARLRYRQRVAAGGGDIDEKIREMYHDGETAEPEDIACGARRCGDHIVVFQRGERPVIKTILYASEGV